MNALQQFISSRPYGFLKGTEDVYELMKLDRLFPVLVRCGGCRFTAAAQDIPHLIECIHSGKDYVRDISFPVGSIERAANWVSDCPVTPFQHIPMRFVERTPAESSANGRKHIVFSESDCGGAFDGSQVISDADPGL